MPTPVGPAPRDPDDPDFWDEWYDDEGDEVGPSSFGWPVRLLALLIVAGIAGLYVFAR